VCGLAVDLDLLARRPNCLAQFHLVMQCASDGSDHRHCCSYGGVPTACLDWCRGEPVQSSQLCALSYSRTIVACFHQGVHTLPSPPRGVTERPLDRSRAVVLWDAPSKNPGSVELYRVFWRPVGEKGTNKTDTVARRIVLEDLQPGTTYELVVKAGNSNGTSQLTPPLKFVTADKYIIATSPVQSNAGGAVGIVLAVLGPQHGCSSALRDEEEEPASPECQEARVPHSRLRESLLQHCKGSGGRGAGVECGP